MKHCMSLNPEPFEMIRLGKKTIELRLNDEKRQKIKIGDEIEFADLQSNCKMLTVVEDIYKFSSFDELYKNLPLSECGYTQEELSTAKASDMDVYYSKEKQKKYGVLGIKIQVIKKEV